MNGFPALLIAFWVSLGISALLAKPILSTLLRLNSRQTVSSYAPETHQKKQGTPTMGGLIPFFGALVAMLVSNFRDPAAIVLLIGFALIGFVDDFVVPRKFVGKRGLGWRQKILMQIVIAAGAAFLARPAPVPAAVLVFFVLFYSNAYNFSDGLDGLAGTILLGLGGGIAALAVLFGGPVEWVVPAVALVGGVIPFLFLNAPPARIFMGDVGSLPIGAVLGYIVGQLALGWPRIDARGLFEYGAGFAGEHVPWIALLAISGVMIVELVPVPLQILSVKVRKKKIFPYTPIHHAFEKAGWPETRVVFYFALAQLLLAVLAVSLAVGVPAPPTPPLRVTVMR